MSVVVVVDCSGSTGVYSTQTKEIISRLQQEGIDCIPDDQSVTDYTPPVFVFVGDYELIEDWCDKNNTKLDRYIYLTDGYITTPIREEILDMVEFIVIDDNADIESILTKIKNPSYQLPPNKSGFTEWIKFQKFPITKDIKIEYITKNQPKYNAYPKYGYAWETKNKYCRIAIS